MSSRWFNVAIVGIWLTTMSWLVTQKIWPALDVGRPPGYSTDDPHTKWQLLLDDKPIGWAESTVEIDKEGVKTLASEVFLEELPLGKLGPAWLLRMVDAPDSIAQMRVRSTVELDPLDRLIGVRTAVDLASMRDVMLMQGVASGDRLSITARTGDFVYNNEMFLPRGGAIGESFSPRTRLGQLEDGQTWTVPVYSPFYAPNAPMEILQATVEGEGPIIWNREIVSTKIVVFRSDPGAGIGDANGAIRGRAWVDRLGRVLRQEAFLWSTKLTFARVPNDEERLRESVPDRPRLEHEASNDAPVDLEVDAP
ncbi:MAG: hypothetical protein SGJ19_21455 [Planctomycetia bacterium]|nr:hypothetical protein [Planctomycetia bacterium]